MENKLVKSCCHCGGTGVLKAYQNVAGDYYFYHCPNCEGTGKREYSKLVTKGG